MVITLIGPKELARRLEVGLPEAKAILAAIADFPVAPGISRLTEDGYRKWYEAKRKEGLQSNANGNVQGKQGAVGSKKASTEWEADLEIWEDGTRGGEPSRPSRRRAS